MEITLTNLQKQVDGQIEARLARVCHAEWKETRVKSKRKPVTYSAIVTDLLSLRQRLYKGESPESIAAYLVGGEIQHAFLKAAPAPEDWA